MDIRIIGGTRNVGHFLSLKLLEHGHRVTVFNTGKTPDELPRAIQRIHGDRSDSHALSAALTGRSFDLVVDMAFYNANDAKVIAGHTLRIKRIDRAVLEDLRLLPDCSPFSDPWMSELDNRRSKLEFGMRYIPLPVYLGNLVAHYKEFQLPASDGDRRRDEEIKRASES